MKLSASLAKVKMGFRYLVKRETVSGVGLKK